MDNLGILIQAILSLKDTTDSKNQIAKELPKLESQLQSDKNTRVKIVAGLDISKSKNLIQSQLNTLANQAKAPTVKIGIDTSGLNSVQSATQNITNSLQTVQTQAQQTASAVREVATSVSYNISDNAFNRLLKDMQIGKNVTDEYKASIRTLANELNESWNTYNLDKYNKTLDTLITTLNNGQAKMRSFTSDSAELARITEELKMYQASIGSFSEKGNKLKFYIDNSFKEELISVLGSIKEVKSALNSMYGVGNWTFNPRKQVEGFESLVNYIDKSDAGLSHFGKTLFETFSQAQAGGNNFAGFFADIVNKVRTLRDTLKFKATPISEIFSSTDTATATRAIEDMIAQAINLSNYEERNRDVFRGFYEEVTTDSGIIVNDLNNIAVAAGNVQRAANQIYIEGWGWVEEVVAEDNQVASSLNTVGKEARETAVALGEIGHNFISNNQVQATFSSIKQAEEYFKGLNLGNVSVGLNKGSLQGLTDFTIKVKSATGEIERFRYAVNNIGDDQNPILEYNLTNINASNEAVQRLIQSQQKAQDKLKALRTSLTADLKSIRSAWQDVNGGKSVKSDENIERLKQQYIKVTQAIRDLRNADDTTLASMKANADAQIDKLNQMVTQYHNAEKVATQLRAKGFETVKIDTGNNIDKFINSINNSKVPIQAMQTEINKLTSDFAQLDTIQDQAGKSASLTNILNTLDNAKTKFQSLKELFKGFGNADWLSVNSEQINKINDMATKIAIYKSNLTATRDEWKSQGIYVGEIQSKVSSLARSLPNIKKPEKFNEWVQEWNDINQKVNQLKVNLDSQVVTHNKIYEIQAQIAKLNPTKDSAEIARLNEKLSAEQKTLSNLQMQSNVYSNLVSLEQQEQYITEQTVKSRDKLLSATNTGVKQYQTTITNAITELQGIANSSVFSKNASNPQVTQTKQEINSLITAYQNLATKLQGNITPAGLETVRTELTQLNARFNTATATAKQFETELRNDNGAEKLAQRVALLKAQIEAYAKANPKAMKKFGDTFNSMIATLNSSPDKMNVDRVAKEFQTVRQEINKADLAGKTFWQTFEEKSQKFIGWMSMTFLYSSMFRAFRSAITNVIELDKAMTNLKKVTDETDATYSKFLNNASSQAKELHSTITDLVEQTAVWAKLGFSLNEAQNLATTSMIYSKVGEVENSKSVSDLVTVMKAFNIESSKSITIVDALNELGGISPLYTVMYIVKTAISVKLQWDAQDRGKTYLSIKINNRRIRL